MFGPWFDSEMARCAFSNTRWRRQQVAGTALGKDGWRRRSLKLRRGCEKSGKWAVLMFAITNVLRDARSHQRTAHGQHLLFAAR